ncbi:nucleotidyltransferase domain-containing protein [Halobacterium salinarum]|uniref:nucleotidyltransferase domain-containing protein n=1 Tax=Halobacterium salinarum TaxID=2242 RepID=UPI002557C5F2|nr:nucleotidyltransferase domain-containing protein [Halobacterium salinarum]MDL0140867.1 nucleotidyltransferase domain-containing protein [Halobacterium salinarum]
MQKNSNTIDSGMTITLDIPAPATGLFRSEAVHDILSFLARYHTDEFSITELTDAVAYSQPTISKNVDTLARNDLIVDRREGAARLVCINGGRLSRPDDPVLQIPQAAFHRPVRTAIDELVTGLEDVLGIVLYGSVAQGTADRRSDIDLWVLVADDRAPNQRAANEVRQDLEAHRFDGDRYEFHIDVEALSAVPTYSEDLQEVLRGGLVVYGTEKFETVRNMVFHGDLNG